MRNNAYTGIRDARAIHVPIVVYISTYSFNLNSGYIFSHMVRHVGLGMEVYK